MKCCTQVMSAFRVDDTPQTQNLPFFNNLSTLQLRIFHHIQKVCGKKPL
jgi:hypothetical protein